MKTIYNRPAFFTGLAYFIIQVFAIAVIVIVSLIKWIDWSWLTFEVIAISAAALWLILHNGVGYLLMRLGLKGPKKK